MKGGSGLALFLATFSRAFEKPLKRIEQKGKENRRQDHDASKPLAKGEIRQERGEPQAEEPEVRYLVQEVGRQTKAQTLNMETVARACRLAPVVSQVRDGARLAPSLESP